MTTTSPLKPKLQSVPAALAQRVDCAGQAHVWRFWDRLGDSGRARLVAQLERIDWAQIARLAKRRAEGPDAGTPEHPNATVEPPIVERPSVAERDAAAARGAVMCREGEVAVLTVAGGQATRLGIDMPKGCYPIGAVTGISLFEHFARQLLRLAREFGRSVPWIIQTSPATRDATVAFFAQHDDFGLDPASVRFVTQATVPALDDHDRVLLETRDRVFENPDGHGGAIAALIADGVLDDLAERGITTLSYTQVDNYHAWLVDPVFLGLHAQRRSELSSKAVPKIDPDERVGLFALVDGQLRVVEYSEFSAEQSAARTDDGELRFRAGNAALHLFDVAFLKRTAGESLDEILPFHVARKVVAHVDADGDRVEPSEPNAFKFERFIFDLLPHAANAMVLEIDRAAEFNPVKNAEGDDSPATARARHREFFSPALTSLVDASGALEVDAAVATTVDELRRALTREVAKIRHTDAGTVVEPADAEAGP